jgi:acyl-coenzyme A thioesterase PaaI-like protein
MQVTLNRTRSTAHPGCAVCGPSAADGLRTDFTMLADGSVQGTCACPDSLQGFPGVLHGGVSATLLDGAMTNCLFARGIVAFTADLQVRYRNLVAVEEEAIVRAWIERVAPPLYVARAELRQGGEVKATARGKFLADRRRR